MSDSDDRIGAGQRIVNRDELAKLDGIADELPCDLEHRWRGVRRKHTMACGEQLLGQVARSAAKLQNQTASWTYQHEQLDDPRSARGGVKPKAAVVRDREVTSTVSEPSTGTWRSWRCQPGSRSQSRPSPEASMSARRQSFGLRDETRQR